MKTTTKSNRGTIHEQKDRSVTPTKPLPTNGTKRDREEVTASNDTKRYSDITP